MKAKIKFVNGMWEVTYTDGRVCKFHYLANAHDSATDWEEDEAGRRHEATQRQETADWLQKSQYEASGGVPL